MTPVGFRSCLLDLKHIEQHRRDRGEVNGDGGEFIFHNLIHMLFENNPISINHE